MRLRHLWLWLAVCVVVVVVLLATSSSTRVVPLSSVTISLLDRTNDAIRGVRTAHFVVTNVDPRHIHYDRPYLEVQGPEDHEAHARLTSTSTGPRSWTGSPFDGAQFPGGGYPWDFVLDEPLESGRWRVLLLV